MVKLNKLGFELLLQAPLSPDEAPSYYWLCTGFKKVFQGKKYSQMKELLPKLRVIWRGKTNRSTKKSTKNRRIGINVSLLKENYVEE